LKLHNFLEFGIKVLENKLGKMWNYLELDQLEWFKLPWMWNYVRTIKKKKVHEKGSKVAGH
jgi:hypothetical protein